MWTSFAFASLFFASTLRVGSASTVNPDVGLTAPELIRSRGFDVESHKVQTDDGYVLTTFRIPNPGGSPIILNHGLLDSAHTFVSNARDQSLSYILADAGYDVWITNNRGNRHSKEHASLNLERVCLPCVEVLGIVTCPFCDKREYWAFDFDHMAAYDMPANVAHVKVSNLFLPFPSPFPLSLLRVYPSATRHSPHLPT